MSSAPESVTRTVEVFEECLEGQIRCLSGHCAEGKSQLLSVYNNTVPYRTHSGAQILGILNVTPGNPGPCK